MRILLAGSTGAIGREVAALLGRAASTRCSPTRCAACATGLIRLSRRWADRWRSVGRFVYIAAHKQAGYEGTAYMQSHEAVVEELRDTKLRHTVIRPTGVFTALAPFVDFARKWFVPLIGDGSARTNPIAAADVARAVVENLMEGPASVSIGGPEIVPRRGIAEAAAKAVGKQPFFMSIPVGVARFNSRAAGVFNKRVGELMAFAGAVSVVECVAPKYGSQRLEEYFASLASLRPLA